jgi:hypothetical protein
VLHRTRHLFIRRQTAVINAIRAPLAEFGIVTPVGRNGVEELLGVVADPNDKRLPEIPRTCLATLGVPLRALKTQIVEFNRRLMAWHRSNETSKRLAGVGPAPASLIQRLSDREEILTLVVASDNICIVACACRGRSPHAARQKRTNASSANPGRTACCALRDLLPF